MALSMADEVEQGLEEGKEDSEEWEDVPTTPILELMFGHMTQTMWNYWMPLLPPLARVRIVARLDDDPQACEDEMLQDLEERGVDVEKWPDQFDHELYRTAMQRTWMARLVVRDDHTQSIFGMPPGQIYNWSQAVRDEVRSSSESMS
ncbi:hypothetical protein DV735_g1107, partial [Chaetothyriales sp. CBS 134920]